MKYFIGVRMKNVDKASYAFLGTLFIAGVSGMLATAINSNNIKAVFGLSEQQGSLLMGGLLLMCAIVSFASIVFTACKYYDDKSEQKGSNSLTPNHKVEVNASENLGKSQKKE